MTKVVLLTNIPVPYREKMHEIISKKLKHNYHVIYCKNIEPNRRWKFKLGDYSKSFLNSKVIKIKNSYLHLSFFKIWNELNKYNPDILINGGLSPAMLFAFLWTKFKRKKHICFTDGTLNSEKNLTLIHRIIRKFVYRFSDSFIGASNKSLNLYSYYNVDKKKIFLSCLCIDNKFFKKFKKIQKKYDIMFSGQFIDRKMPLFFIKVVKELKKQKKNYKILIIGSGPLKYKITSLLKKYEIDYFYPGFVQQKNLPKYYAFSKLFLFPTKQDPWGIVANEACAVGLPVITCSNAGCANELIINKYNGYILPLDTKIWAKYCRKILEDRSLYTYLSNNAFKRVQYYNYENAAKGILNAINFVQK